jgi:prepilin-type N-terminal cleavage/methylation domain-containing protein
MKTMLLRRGGFTLVEVMVVVAIIGLLAAIAIPNFVRARNTTQRVGCIENLRQISYSKHQWALENKKTDLDAPTWGDMSTYLRSSGYSNCPAHGIYTINPVRIEPTCSVATHVVPPP